MGNGHYQNHTFACMSLSGHAVPANADVQLRPERQICLLVVHILQVGEVILDLLRAQLPEPWTGCAFDTFVA